MIKLLNINYLLIKHHYAISFIFILVITSLEAQIYISPNGNDNNSGTKENPFLSLSAARDAIRKNKNTLPKNKSIIIHIEKGMYFMEKPLILNSGDGGTKEHPIIYKAKKGETPVFSGGKQINGFKVNKNGVWEAQIPKIKNQTWRFDQLYVNGKRATLAKTPNNGFLTIDDIKENVLIKGTGRAPEKAEQIISFDSKNFEFLKSISKNEIKNTRFRTYHNWDFTLRLLDSIDFESKTVYTTGQGMKPWNPIKKDGRIVFENFKVALDIPGEWFLNEKGTLYYFPVQEQ